MSSVHETLISSFIIKKLRLIEKNVAFAQRSDIIGYRSVLSNEVACTTAHLIKEAILCFIPADVFIDLLKFYKYPNSS